MISGMRGWGGYHWIGCKDLLRFSGHQPCEPFDYSAKLSFLRVCSYVPLACRSTQEYVVAVSNTGLKLNTKCESVTKKEIFKMKQEKLQAELERLENMKVYEKEYASKGLICGIDEAGRGPLAGPVVAAAVILPEDVDYIYLNDSKKVTEKRREALFEQIVSTAVSYGIGVVSHDIIDDINILQATYMAMRLALENMNVKPEVCLVDAVNVPELDIFQVPIIKGDAKSISIAAASVLAKVTRDRMMAGLGEKYPQYGFEKHKGYGTKAHMEAIREFGPCPEHRKTFISSIV